MQVCIRFIVSLFLLLIGLEGFAQQTEAAPPQPSYVTQLCVYEGDTIPYVSLPAVYIYQPLQFKNKRSRCNSRTNARHAVTTNWYAMSRRYCPSQTRCSVPSSKPMNT